MQTELGMFLNGVILISCILNFQTGRFSPGNDLPPTLFLPTYTTTAWYHKKLPEDLQADFMKTITEVTTFALHDYTLAMMKGDKLNEDETEQIASQLVRFTGLSKKYVKGTNLRVNIYRFVKELLRDEHRTVGRLDSRFTGIDKDDTGMDFEFDPSYAVIQGSYTATLNDYVRHDLNFTSDLPYEILAPLYKKWKYEDYHNQFLNVAETLRQAMSMNPFLKVFVGNGYFDLATPFFATQYTFDHLELDPSLRKNITMAFYEAGHMMYLHPPSLRKLRGDLVAFIRSALPSESD